LDFISFFGIIKVILVKDRVVFLYTGTLEEEPHQEGKLEWIPSLANSLPVNPSRRKTGTGY
jgi:hypothetical protein